jgi:hypothetical protein
VATFLGVLVYCALPELHEAREESSRVQIVQENTVVLTLLGLPFIGFVFAKLSHGGMTDRYMIAGVLGVVIASMGRLFREGYLMRVIVADGDRRVCLVDRR